MARAQFTIEEAEVVGTSIEMHWSTSPFDVDQLRTGMDVEFEHGSHDPQTDVTGDDPVVTAEIAWAHLKKLADSCVRLAKMEAEAEQAQLA